MKYTVIVGGNPYVVLAERMWKPMIGVCWFVDGDIEGDYTTIAEFKDDKIDGVIMGDGNGGE